MTCILFAAGIDWLENLLPVLFVGFWILSQVFAVFRRVVGDGRPAQPPVARLPKPAPPELPRPAPPPMIGQDREDLDRQIEEFLRRATGAPAPRPVERKKAAPPSQPATQKPAAQKPAIATDVASHVREAFAHDLKHDRSPLGGTPVAARRPAAADAAPSVGAPAVRSPETIAAQLARALRNPNSIRKAILLREVLERPVDRW